MKGEPEEFMVCLNKVKRSLQNSSVELGKAQPIQKSSKYLRKGSVC